MASQAILSGRIPDTGIFEVLGDVERLGTTGVLLFEGQGCSGRVQLLHGQIVDAENGETDPETVERLFALQEGEFAVYQKLPPLPVSRGDDSCKRGSLTVHPPSELMRYCEGAGLTGRLLLEREGRLAVATYQRGELIDVSIDDAPSDEFVRALEWEVGTFRIDTVIPRLHGGDESTSVSEREAEPSGMQLRARFDPHDDVDREDPTGIQFLRAVEMGLADLAQQPPLAGVPRPPLPKRSGSGVRATASESKQLESSLRLIEDEEDDDPTIRIVHRQSVDDDTYSDLRARRRRGLPKQVPMPKRAAGKTRAPGSATTPGVTEEKEKTTLLGGLGWVVAIALCVLGCLVLLAQLPALE